MDFITDNTDGLKRVLLDLITDNMVKLKKEPSQFNHILHRCIRVGVVASNHRLFRLNREIIDEIEIIKYNLIFTE